MNSYYPFGLTFNSYQRVTTKENKLNTFQDQEKITALDLNWIQFKWRNHDPAIGRFFNVDPLADKYVYNSPYAFSENKLISYRELEGLEAARVIFAEEFKKDAQAISYNIEKSINNTINGVKHFFRSLKVKEGSGDTQPAGNPLVSKTPSPSPTKQKADHTGEEIDVDLLLKNIGGAGMKKELPNTAADAASDILDMWDTFNEIETDESQDQKNEADNSAKGDISGDSEASIATDSLYCPYHECNVSRVGAKYNHPKAVEIEDKKDDEK